MKKIFLLIWLAMLLQACQTSPVHQNAIYLLKDSNYAYIINQSNQWTINPDSRNAKTAMTALKAFEIGDTALLKTCVADSLTVHYDGGTYKGGKHEFMFAIIEVVKALKNLRLKVKDCQSVVSIDKQEEKVTTWYTQYWTTPQGLADSADVIDDARFKDGKIVVWYDYMRRYKTPPHPTPKGRE
jgi:predicted SnoaL-like aldol condensation-catalyzing enzyme